MSETGSPGAGDTGDTEQTTEAAVCSAKGCQQPAEHQLLWNNPKIHTPDRRKTWLTCGEHREHLGSFLQARGFLREVVPHA